MCGAFDFESDISDNKSVKQNLEIKSSEQIRNDSYKNSWQMSNLIYLASALLAVEPEVLVVGVRGISPIRY